MTRAKIPGAWFAEPLLSNQRLMSVRIARADGGSDELAVPEPVAGFEAQNADALTMAAAKDMLAALEAVVAEFGWKEPLPPDTHDCVHPVLAAIAKAKGRAEVES